MSKNSKSTAGSRSDNGAKKSTSKTSAVPGKSNSGKKEYGLEESGSRPSEEKEQKQKQKRSGL